MTNKELHRRLKRVADLMKLRGVKEPYLIKIDNDTYRVSLQAFEMWSTWDADEFTDLSLVMKQANVVWKGLNKK